MATERVDLMVSDSTPATKTSPGVSSLSGSPLRGIVFVVTLVIAGIGIRVHVPGGIAAVNAAAFAVTAVWALVGFVNVHAPERAPGQFSPFHLLVGADALVAAVALATSRMALTGHHPSGGAARDVATIASVLVTAISFHLLLALPDGRLPGRARGGVVLTVYAAALIAGIVLAFGHHTFSVVDGAVSWTLAAAVAAAPMRLRYAQALGHDRERLQWFGIGTVATVLHLLLGWPGPLAAVVVGGSTLIPLGLLLGESRRLAPHGSRMLVQTLSVFGFIVVVSAIYLIAVLGLGHAPKTSGDKDVLALSMVATGVAALIFVPVRERLLGSATRFVYGAREAPDEVLRTFGSRLTRAIPMDELLLQLAESLRKTMGLTSAEIYTGMGEVLERAVSVPDSGPKSRLGERLDLGLAARPHGRTGEGPVAGGADQPCWRAARPGRGGTAGRRRLVLRGRRPRPHRPGSPGRAGLSQLAARHCTPDHARRVAQAGRRAQGIPGPDRGQR
jgi:hypothetical protein